METYESSSAKPITEWVIWPPNIVSVGLFWEGTRGHSGRSWAMAFPDKWWEEIRAGRLWARILRKLSAWLVSIYCLDVTTSGESSWTSKTRSYSLLYVEEHSTFLNPHIYHIGNYFLYFPLDCQPKEPGARSLLLFLSISSRCTMSSTWEAPDNHLGFNGQRVNGCCKFENLKYLK